MNVLFTCGGTAGHVNPAVALARIFQERHPGCRILFVGADGGMENKLVPKEGYQIRSVTITNFHRSFAPADIAHNLGTLMNMQRSKKQARAILDEFKPDLVVGTGGYASFPVVNEAARRRIPTAVHESNAVPGLTTKALARVVDRVMVGFEESREHYDSPDKVVVTGTPVRGDFFRYSREEARQKLGFSDDRPLLLSYWGSLGAETFLSFGLTGADWLRLGLAGGTLLAVELLLEKGVPLRERLDQRPAWVQFALLFGAVLLLTAFVYLNTDYTAIMYVYENV